MVSVIVAKVVCGYVVNMEFGVHASPQGNPLEPATYTLGFSVTDHTHAGAAGTPGSTRPMSPVNSVISEQDICCIYLGWPLGRRDLNGELQQHHRGPPPQIGLTSDKVQV